MITLLLCLLIQPQKEEIVYEGRVIKTGVAPTPLYVLEMWKPGHPPRPRMRLIPGPGINLDDYVGKDVKVYGTLNKQGEFTVIAIHSP